MSARPFSITFPIDGWRITIAYDRAIDRFTLAIDGRPVPQTFYSRAAAEEYARAAAGRGR